MTLNAPKDFLESLQAFVLERYGVRIRATDWNPDELPDHLRMRIEVAGDGPADERAFFMALPPQVPLPFKVGDSIVMKLETVPGPPTWQPRNAVLTRDNGELLAADGVLSPGATRVHRA